MEIELMKRLDHPNIVRYLTYMKTKEMLYIVLEYVTLLFNLCRCRHSGVMYRFAKTALAGIIKKTGPFVESFVCAIFARYVFCELFQFLSHSVCRLRPLSSQQGVIHRHHAPTSSQQDRYCQAGFRRCDRIAGSEIKLGRRQPLLEYALCFISVSVFAVLSMLVPIIFWWSILTVCALQWLPRSLK